MKHDSNNSNSVRPVFRIAAFIISIIALFIGSLALVDVFKQGVFNINSDVLFSLSAIIMGVLFLIFSLRK